MSYCTSSPIPSGSKANGYGRTEPSSLPRPYDPAIMISKPADGDFAAAFGVHFRREYGYDMAGRDLVIDDVRVRGVANSSLLRRVPIQAAQHPLCLPEPDSTTSVYFEGGWRDTPVYLLGQLLAGAVIEGPAVVMNGTSTCIIEPQCVAEVTEYGDLKIQINTMSSSPPPLASGRDGAGVGDTGPVSELESAPASMQNSPDAIQLSIFSNRFMGIAEQMGRTLQRTSVSTNIKERLDFSCALFGPDGGLVANAPHVPVHLGAMSSTVQWQLEHWCGANGATEGLVEGDVLVTNHPRAGGSHLPDITVVTPVFRGGKIVFLVASRVRASGHPPSAVNHSSHALVKYRAAVLIFSRHVPPMRSTSVQTNTHTSSVAWHSSDADDERHRELGH